MRLTKKKIISSQNTTYEIIPNFECDRGTCITTELIAIHKLGQLEDVEEELGLSLITIGKMLVKGFYVKHDSDIEKAIFKGIWLEYKKIYFTTQSYDGELYFDDYDKTWALTKEELDGH